MEDKYLENTKFIKIEHNCLLVDYYLDKKVERKLITLPEETYLALTIEKGCVIISNGKSVVFSCKSKLFISMCYSQYASTMQVRWLNYGKSD